MNTEAIRSESSPLLLGLTAEAAWRNGVMVRLALRLTSGQGDAVGRRLPWAEELLELLHGSRAAPSFPFLARGTPFQERVWRQAARIPRGSTITYGGLARQLGCGSARAVGQALKANPLPIIIPCHRVVAAKGPGGYSCGLGIKRLLLQVEGAIHEAGGDKRHP